jgi:5-methylcytosine-specific restriction endonuclease McrA
MCNTDKHIPNCPRCGGERYGKVRPSSGRIDYRCKPCHQLREKEHRANNKDRERERQRRWLQGNKEHRNAYDKNYRDGTLNEYYQSNEVLDLNIGKHSNISYCDCPLCTNVFLIKGSKNKMICSLCMNCVRHYTIGGNKLFRHCKICNLVYNGYYGNVNTCSTECQDILRKEGKLKHHQKRRAIKKGVYSDTVSRLNVFKRDNYKCKACKSKVYIGQRDPKKMATIDHIVPLSKGGSHTMSNLQTMCKSCNSSKNNNVDGQQLTIFCGLNNKTH